MALRARRIFSGLRFAIEMRWRSDYPAWLNPVRLLSTAQVTSRFFRELLRRKLKGRNVISYFETHVSNRLGLRDLKYKKDEHGNPLPVTGFELTPPEWARPPPPPRGNGNYHRRQIVPSGLLREAFDGSQVNPAYGLTFWLNEQAPNGREADMERMLDLPWQNTRWSGVCICKDAPADMAVALGSHYQRLFIIPSLKAVIVRQGSGGNFSDAQFCGYCLGEWNEQAGLICLVCLANDQSIMGDHSQDEQALAKIQHEWAAARVKGARSVHVPH